MAGNQENILVEFDYDNISLIDPNKVVDELGNVKDRLVKQEDLVFYANLECNVLPRTKLAVGSSMNDSSRTISVGRINFLNPGNKTFLDDAWADEITGKNTITGLGVNQPNQESVQTGSKTTDYYVTQNLWSNGTPGAVDNGLLGLKSIKVSIGTDFLPVIDVDLEDVKGRALFEAGNNSPYSAFFQLPYPQFTLTLKGYYGKAIKFPIMLQSFTSTFDPSTHNFQIKLKFYGYKYTLLSYVNFGALMAVPNMYKNTVTVTPVVKEQGNIVSGSNSVTAPQVVSRGYQKMKEVYSIYKSKGLIDDNFPEITLLELKYRLQNFITEVLSQFEKENLGLLTDMTLFTNNLLTYQQIVYLYSSSSWFANNMDRDYPIVLKENQNAYFFKPGLTPDKISFETARLESDIALYRDLLGQNGVFGLNGSYTINGKKNQSNIPNDISLKTFVRKRGIQDIDLVATYVAQKNAPKGNFKESDSVIINFRNQLQESLKNNDNNVWVFEGPGTFMEITNEMAKKASEFRKDIESAISESLAVKFNAQGNGGLGFVPSIRNILAIFYCQGEAFLRLMDEVHKKAWDVRENPYRRAAIFGNVSAAPSVDVKTSTQNNEPIYPWPQVIKESVGEDNKEKFEIIYPGEQTVATIYRAYSPEVWPEVEFVEQFIKGYTERTNNIILDTISLGTNIQPNRESLNALDFPITDEVFQNKEETKYFYEIYERLIVNAYYSRFNRKSGYGLSIYEAEADSEAVNVLQSLGVDNPFLSKTLKEYLLDSQNYVPFLRHISNQGQGESWQLFARGEFVTPYLRNDSLNPNTILNATIFNSLKSQPTLSLSNANNITNLNKYLSNSTTTNEFDFVDLYPITNFSWVKSNMANGQSLNNETDVFDTKLVLNYNEIHKTVTNFKLGDSNDVIRPFTYFNFKNLDVTPSTSNLKLFYNTREYKNQLVTEGNLNYVNYDNYLTETQTTSMMNTPYFINAIQEGVFNFRYKQNDQYPYKNAAYLFLNSLPLATLKEKYKTLENDSTTELDYILSTFKKFGATHRIPYSWILKYGSIWHRYKVFKETGTDMLDSVWKNFNYLENWDPINSASTLNYQLTVDGVQRDLVLDSTVSGFTNINTGFYPQLMDDYNVFIQGLKLFSGQTQVTGSCVVQTITGTCNTIQVTGTCSTTGTGITINSITNNFITLPHTIYLPALNANIQLLTQVSGTTGGTGYYTTPLNFNAAFSNLDFVLGSFGYLSNTTPYQVQPGQIISGSPSVSVVTVLSLFSASTGPVQIYELSNTSAETYSYTVLNSPVQVISISNNVITNGSVLNGPNLNGNLTLGPQVSGTTGGVGLYLNSSIQPPTISQFVVQGAYIQGYGSQQIQSYINDEKLILLNTTTSTIFETPGFDPNSSSRSMRISPWSVIVRSNLDPDSYYVTPSFGSNINQAKLETFKNEKMLDELSSNPAMYNGSVRLFWNVPQYGWFDNSKVVKNTPDTYLKKIISDKSNQQNFSINGIVTEYSNFEELYTAFDLELLDKFEYEFLNFSRSIYDYVDTLPNYNVQAESVAGSQQRLSQESDNEKSYKNFQYLMRTLMLINKPTGTTPETKLENIISQQNQKFQTVLGEFLNYNVAFRFGNPTNFNKRLYTTFSTRYIEDPIIYGPYQQGNLPPQVTLAQSKLQNPDVWKALEFYVGNSTIPQLEYKNSGSYITDFFIQMNVGFNEKNVQDFAPIIKIFATQKLKDSSLNLTNFYNLMDNYLVESENYIGNVLNVMLPLVRKNLPNVIIGEDTSATRAGLEAGFTEQTRTELWETFKALNDTWIAGFDFETKTLFEDVMLVDRASRNVGDKILVDIFGIINLLEDGETEKNKGSNSYRNTLLDMVTTILVTNNFQHFMLPAYVNFYNVQDAAKNPTPRPDGTLEVGNMMFGNYLNVDYRESSPKFLCYYVSKPSEHLKMNDEYRFRDDGFDLRRASDNPLIENLANKTDWDKSNKIVGFNIDITRENQQLFTSFSVSQDPGKPTTESLAILDQMANVQKNRRSSTQNVSLYNLYKNRSYSCSVDMMGCALIQPMMYFNLRNVPMFSGPYMILSVTHTIDENNFKTTFEGVRQPFYSLPTVDNFLQTLNTTLNSQLQQKIREQEIETKAQSVNVLIQAQNTIANLDSEDTLTKNQDCATQINPRYLNFVVTETPSVTSYSTQDLYNTIDSVLTGFGESPTGQTYLYLSTFMFTFVYVDSGTSNGSGIKSYENNFSTIALNETYGNEFFQFINRRYYCVSRGSNPNLPVVSFRSLTDFLKFVYYAVRNLEANFEKEIKFNFSQFPDKEADAYTLAKLYVLYYPVNQNQNVYAEIEKDENQITKLRSEFLKALDVLTSVSKQV